jgi:hypothetical protein
MLKKALACASLAVAATGAAAGLAPAAQASDTHGGDYTQNVNALPHLCADVKRVNVINFIPVDVLTQTDGQHCNEKTKLRDEHKAPLSDLIDLGAFQH